MVQEALKHAACKIKCMGLMFRAICSGQFVFGSFCWDLSLLVDPHAFRCDEQCRPTPLLMPGAWPTPAPQRAFLPIPEGDIQATMDRSHGRPCMYNTVL